jgi:plasmid replication initiation protein
MLVYHYARVSALDKAGDIKFRILTYYIADLPFRDHRETMERPFFSLSKRKRLRPIDYQSPDGRVWIKVSPHGEHGMATIWDADILIWATSQILERCRRGEPMQRVIAFRPNELLRAIGRVYNASGCAGGKSYVELKAALDRLKNTNIRTNIRVLNGNRLRRDEGSFSWIDEWRYVEAEGEAPLMEFELSRWVYEGILQRGGVLAIDPAYFSIDGGLERALYRIARKHAGLQGAFRIHLDTLHKKAGSDASLREFRRMLKGIAGRNTMPGYCITYDRDGDAVTFTARDGQGSVGETPIQPA